MNVALAPPPFFWLISGLSLPWTAFGAYDFLMINARDAAYIAPFPPEMMQFVDGMPYWALGAWALAVGAALLGSLLLLLRSRFADPAFAASAAGLAASTVYWVRTSPESLWTGARIGMAAAMWLIAIVLLGFAMTMRKRGVLR